MFLDSNNENFAFIFKNKIIGFIVDEIKWVYLGLMKSDSFQSVNKLAVTQAKNPDSADLQPDSSDLQSVPIIKSKCVPTDKQKSTTQ